MSEREGLIKATTAVTRVLICFVEVKWSEEEIHWEKFPSVSDVGRFMGIRAYMRWCHVGCFITIRAYMRWCHVGYFITIRAYMRWC